jgi:UPF0755 protein
VARRRSAWKLGCLGLALGLVAGAAWVWSRVNGPAPSPKPGTVRFDRSTGLAAALGELQSDGLVLDARATVVWARVAGAPRTVREGTYRIPARASGPQAVAALQDPLRQMVRLPEGWWIARTAERLEENGVCAADEYRRLADDPSQFQKSVKFKLPTGSLEGCLFPDTYDLPPLLGARATIERQLQAFESKVLPILPEDADLQRVLTVASMVELEAARDDERARIAGVIENRLRRGMRLEIDATVLYAEQNWRELGPGQVRKTDSPYNTYRRGGLPPGPIGSPSLKSIQAALRPERHGYLFYVARPDRSHYFAATYPDHLANIRRARAERAGR